MDGMLRPCLAAIGFLLLAQPALCAAQGRAPDPRFGIVETFVNPAAATEAGAGFTRVILRWDVIQPAGPADWKPANVPDPFIERELADGRQVVGLLISTPAWASAGGTDGAERTADGRAVPKMDAWEAFVRRMAQQYRGRIRHWVIWNEPDVWEPDHPGSTWLGNEADYARLLKTAYRAIKEVDPGAEVAMAGQTYFWDWTHGRRLYLDRLLDALVADPEAAAGGFFFDVVPYHLYFNPTQAPQVIGEVKAALARRGITGKEIWINETNAPPSNDPQEQPWSAPRYRISLDEQAAFVIQQFSQAFAAGASRVEIYKLRNSADHPELIEPFGLLRADDPRRPAFDAYWAVTTYLRDFRGVTKQQLGDVVAFTFDRGGETTTVLWTWGRTPARVRVKAIAPEGLAGRRARPGQRDQSGGWQLSHRLARCELRQHGGVRARHRRRAAAAGGIRRGSRPGRAHPAADIDAHTHAVTNGDEHGNLQPGADRKPNARAVTIADRNTRSSHAYRHRGASNANCGSSDHHSRRDIRGNGGRDASGYARESSDLDLRGVDRRQRGCDRPGRKALLLEPPKIAAQVNGCGLRLRARYPLRTIASAKLRPPRGRGIRPPRAG